MYARAVASALLYLQGPEGAHACRRWTYRHTQAYNTKKRRTRDSMLVSTRKAPSQEPGRLFRHAEMGKLKSGAPATPCW
jgi:hypothetical protein